MASNNVRIVYDNAADRATLSADSTAGSLVAAYMQNDYKGQAHRSTGTSVVYTATWATAEAISCVALPATNLTSSATIRAQAYSDAACTVQIADTGTVYAAPGAVLGLWNWNTALNANAFAFGGVTKTALYFSPVSAKGVKITLSDPTNAAGYIDCARLVIGNYWAPTKNADYGAKMAVVDTTKSDRNHAGDNLPELGLKYDRLAIDLRLLNEADRAQLMRIARGPGSASNIFVSLFPDDERSLIEQDGMVFGKFPSSDVSADAYAVFSKSVSVEGW